MGSFLNVLSLRYDPESFLLTRAVVGGRSRCPACRATLRWYELVPLVSFLVQRGRCRTCGDRVSFQYPLVEALCGLIFLLVPLRLDAVYPFLRGSPLFFILAALWIAAFAALLLLSLIDLRLFMIPDEVNALLGALGVCVAAAVAYAPADLGALVGTLLGPYALLFGGLGSAWANHIAGAALAGAFLWFIVFATRGKGMGMGDVKLAAPLGLIFGWPDIVVVVGLSFIIGALYSAYRMARGTASLKSAVPFGPFLALAAAIVFFFGEAILRFYFTVFAANLF